ncbi:MAG: hypothetical protein QCI82_11270 [Candidatus Thermoplasmatota archaeon]|nr:hypothetical protein [Candidatus Thermoplasmatota archaeon]
MTEVRIENLVNEIDALQKSLAIDLREFLEEKEVAGSCERKGRMGP